MKKGRELFQGTGSACAKFLGNHGAHKRLWCFKRKETNRVRWGWKEQITLLRYIRASWKGLIRQVIHFCLFFLSVQKWDGFLRFAFWKDYVGYGVKKWLKQGSLDLYRWVGNFKMFRTERKITWTRKIEMETKTDKQCVRKPKQQTWMIN